jgi:hypothetical protein
MIFVYSIRDMFVCSLAKTFGHLSDRAKKQVIDRVLTMEHYICNKVFVSPSSAHMSVVFSKYFNKSSDDAEADILINDAPMLFTKPGFDEYAFVAESGEYALNYFDVKVARSIRQKD